MPRRSRPKNFTIKLIVGLALATILIPIVSAIVAAKRHIVTADSRPAATPTPAPSAPKEPAQGGEATPHATPPRPPTARLSGITVLREMDIPHWLGPGQFAWNDDGVPPGETVIVVNIRARVLSAFRGGIEIGRSSLIYGATHKPTPHGSFPILEKDADHHSNLYDAPMPHMLRLTWDGVAIHGSPELSDDLATHGCIGLPKEFARLLFGAVRLGDRVVVWDGEKDKAA